MAETEIMSDNQIAQMRHNEKYLTQGHHIPNINRLYQTWFQEEGKMAHERENRNVKSKKV
jgi:hypothetical protein